MMMKIRTGLAALLCAALLLPMCVFAAGDDYPHEIWRPLDAFAAALDAGDDWGIYDFGNQVIGIMEAQPESQLRTEFLAGKYEQVSRAAERLGYYDAALELYRRYLPYGQAMGWTDGVKYAQKKLYLLQGFLDVYMEDTSYTPPHYGAKFEPQRGVLFGSVYDDDPRILDFDNDLILQQFPKQNSTWLIYLEFGDNPRELGRYNRYLSRAEELGIGVELAWNTYDPKADIASYDAYIRDVVNFLGEYNIPIFLRFGAEMNIGANGADAAAYVNGFRYVADIARQKSNIAMVWSPSDISSLDRTYTQYYPGDAYVDWVGMSLYVAKYFEGRKDHGSQTDPLNTYFAMDEFANPLMRVHELMAFMEENNIQKPVMISECGVSHYVRTENEDLTGWAKTQLRKLYSELLIRYPRVKMVNYFNVQIENETNAYELFTNASVNEVYNAMVENPYFLSNFKANAPYGYRWFGGGTVGTEFALTAVGYYPKTLYNTVKFYLDGAWVSELYDAPYTMRFAGVAPGAHTITVELCDGGQVKLKREYEIWVEPEIGVEINGTPVAFPDQKPVMIDNRTMVPVRGVFEQIGMTVEWDGAAQKVTMRRGSDVITLTIGSKTLYVNGVPTEMDVAAQMVNDRTMIPLRFVGQAAGAAVEWDGNTHTAKLVLGH